MKEEREAQEKLKKTWCWRTTRLKKRKTDALLLKGWVFQVCNKKNAEKENFASHQHWPTRLFQCGTTPKAD